MRKLLWLPFALACSLSFGAEYPEAEISNGVVTARLHLPDFERGSYHGTRFDWSGIIYSLEFKGHEYFGQWYPKHDRMIHDAITGPVEEFGGDDLPPGYAEAKPGETFMRIGVGTVKKPDEPRYNRFRTYEIVDPGKWTVKKSAASIEFVHTLTSPDGYAYEYHKTVSLPPGRAQLLLTHSLINKGNKPIDTVQYDHNFFVIDKEVVGPEVVVRFPFNPQPKQDLKLAEIKDKALLYKRDLQTGESVFSEMTGYGATAKDYDFRIENQRSGAGVRIRGDQPLARVIFWSIRTVACPEPYVRINVAPGESKTWTMAYDFYPLEQYAQK